MCTINTNYKSKTTLLRSKPPIKNKNSSRLLELQANFQARQLEEKEDKLITYLESKNTKGVNTTRENLKSGNSLTSSSSSNSFYGDRMSEYGFCQNRQVMPDLKLKASISSPIGWDKSYPLKPVKKVEQLFRKQTTENHNKYSGNYGPKSQPKQINRRGMSLERSFVTEKINTDTFLSRTQSQSFIGSSSEDSYTSSRPPSGFDYIRAQTRCPVYLSSDDSNNAELKLKTRDYTKPLPPTYRKPFNISSNNDSAYSSHNSERSEAKLCIKNSGKNQNYNRNYLNSFENEIQINSHTFKKQKSPSRKIHREAKYIASRSDDLTDDEKELHQKVKKSERQREEDRRRMQFEMRKREQELLAKIKVLNNIISYIFLN